VIEELAELLVSTTVVEDEITELEVDFNVDETGRLEEDNDEAKVELARVEELTAGTTTFLE
jgi:hypothetical protein